MKPVEYVAVPFDVVKRHMDAAVPEAERLFAEASSEKRVKPYAQALAYALALRMMSETFGWKPEHFFDLIQTIEHMRKPPEAKG